MKGKTIGSSEDDVNLTINDQDNQIQINISEEIEKVAKIINNLKDTALKMKGAEVKMKDWSFLITHSEGEYTLDFKLMVSVKPEKM